MEWIEAVRIAEVIVKDLVEIYNNEGLDGILDMILGMWREQEHTNDGWITIKYEILLGHVINTPYYIWITEDDKGVEIGDVFVSLNDVYVDIKTREKFEELCNELWDYLSAFK